MTRRTPAHGSTGGFFRPAVVLGIGVVGAIIVSVKVYEARSLHAALHEAGATVEELRGRVMGIALPDSDEQAVWESHKERVMKKLLLDRDSPLLLKELATLVSGYTSPNVSILDPTAVQPGQRQARGDPKADASDRLLIRIAFQSHYADLIRFFDRIGRLERYLEIEAFTVTRNPPRVSVEVTLKAVNVKHAKRMVAGLPVRSTQTGRRFADPGNQRES